MVTISKMLSHKVGLNFLAASGAGSALAIIACVFTNGLVELLILAVFGFFTFPFPLFLSLASNYEPEGPSSLGNALVWGLGASRGSVIGPLIIGALVQTNYQRLRFAFEIMAAAILIAAAGHCSYPELKHANPLTHLPHTS